MNPIASTSPAPTTSTLFCTIDTSRVEGNENETHTQPGTIRQAIEKEIRISGGHQGWRLCRNETELQQVKDVARKVVVAGARALRDQLYPVKVDNANRTGILDLEGNVLPGAVEMAKAYAASNYHLHLQHSPQYSTQSQNLPTQTPTTTTNAFPDDPLTTWSGASYTGPHFAVYPLTTIARQDYQHQSSHVLSAGYAIPLPQQASMSLMPLNSMRTPARLSPSAAPSGVQLPYYDQEGLQAVPPYASYTVSFPHRPVGGPMQMASVYSSAQYSQYVLRMEDLTP
ncbi:hypothetical protein BDZ45DRAFT_802332 [Acephala macrosclerotiorum]|nr:hypothetical protein BDZ45DRAFT_802332 [Acephala macrosclerotiorum]